MSILFIGQPGCGKYIIWPEIHNLTLTTFPTSNTSFIFTIEWPFPFPQVPSCPSGQAFAHDAPYFLNVFFTLCSWYSSVYPFNLGSITTSSERQSVTRVQMTQYCITASYDDVFVSWASLSPLHSKHHVISGHVCFVCLVPNTVLGI
jgi:hypothetical protein